ncbi:ribosome maturation factor RimP [Micropruina sp.]|uniref:ribosome maturation factor RimP n=1 Tax=Micropruina sp. TaxID=2737536 RepID=UPI002627F051|nr:ribosome maturation factor RimP [Micropruina sp.]
MDPTTISDLVTPVVTSCGLEVDRVEVLPAGKRRVVRIFLDGDGPQGRGPSLDEIADATRAISRELDDAPAMGSRPWTLEVSSRGVSRPLTEAKHYRRNTGRLISASTADGEITGRITGTTDTEVTLDVAGTPHPLALDSITRAVVQVELNRSIDDEGQ